jgi:hypothetical protein
MPEVPELAMGSRRLFAKTRLENLQWIAMGNEQYGVSMPSLFQGSDEPGDPVQHSHDALDAMVGMPGVDAIGAPHLLIVVGRGPLEVAEIAFA